MHCFVDSLILTIDSVTFVKFTGEGRLGNLGITPGSDDVMSSCLFCLTRFACFNCRKLVSKFNSYLVNT